MSFMLSYLATAMMYVVTSFSLNTIVVLANVTETKQFMIKGRVCSNISEHAHALRIIMQKFLMNTRIKS